jgi:acetyl-CoA/propionyl-CoA carboxylase carboxyl transferase subunit
LPTQPPRQRSQFDALSRAWSDSDGGQTVTALEQRTHLPPVGRDPCRRLETVLDRDSLSLEPVVPGSGVVAGVGTVGDNPVVGFASDPREGGGALSESGSAVIVRAIERAVRDGAPLVGVWQSGGARLQDGTSSLDGVGRIFRAIVLASGRVPIISVVLGPAAGGAAYGPALTDFVISGPDGRIFVTGPDIVRRVTGENVDALTLGGPLVHSRASGVVHSAEETDLGALRYARSLLRLFAIRRSVSAGIGTDRRLSSVLPASSRTVYDVRDVVRLILDADTAPIELHRWWAPNIVTTYGRINGMTVGILANNPLHLAGCLDCAASEKAAAFVQKSASLGIPLVVLADVPGYLPGRDQESNGVVMRGARLLNAFARANVPRVTVILRKAYGGAFIAMNSKSLGATAVFAWPSAEVGVMYPNGAVEIIYRRRLAETAERDRPALVEALAREYEGGAGGLRRALACGHIDGVIDPAETRSVVWSALTGQPRRIDLLG